MVNFYEETELAKKKFLDVARISPEKPIQFDSGYFMPMYMNTRALMFHHDDRTHIIHALYWLMRQNVEPSIIAGVETAGIPWAAWLAEKRQYPFVYVRKERKTHGLERQIEGGNVNGNRVVVLEELLSTGQTAIDAIKTVRSEGGVVKYCLSLFSYNFPETQAAFEALDPPCKSISLLTYDEWMTMAKEAKKITPADVEKLNEWNADPFNWGEKHGFPRIQR